MPSVAFQSHSGLLEKRARDKGLKIFESSDLSGKYKIAPLEAKHPILNRLQRKREAWTGCGVSREDDEDPQIVT